MNEDDEPRPLLPRRVRAILLGVFALLAVVGFFLPNVAIRSDLPHSRWLPGTSSFFLGITTDKLPGVNPDLAGFGFTVVFLGLGIWELGLLMTLLSAWILASADVNRWLWVFLLLGTILLAFGPSTVVLGKLLLDAAHAPTTLGWAWLPSFVGGFALLIWTLRARRMVDNTMYAKPELIT